MRIPSGTFVATAGVLLLAICSSLNGKDKKWEALNQRFTTIFNQGDYDKAGVVAKKALALAQRKFGPEHVNTATSLNDLAEVYSKQARYEEAEPLYKRSLAIKEEALGPNHIAVAESINNLAQLYHAQGRYAEAEPLFRRSLEIVEKTFGPDHLNVAKVLANLAALHQQPGPITEADELMNRVEEIKERTRRSDLENMQGWWRLVSFKQNGVEIERPPYFYLFSGATASVFKQDQLQARFTLNVESSHKPKRMDIIGTRPDGCIEKNEVIYEIERDTLRWSHIATKRPSKFPDEAGSIGTIVSLRKVERNLGQEPNNLALYQEFKTLYEQAQTDEAVVVGEKALALAIKELGPEHPNTASALDNLAQLYFTQGRYAAAVRLYQRSLRIREKALGPDHPDVAQSLKNLAELHRVLGRYGNQQDEALRIIDNLRSLAAGAQTLMIETGVAEAGYSDIVGEGKPVSRIEVVAGEKYSDVHVETDSTRLSVTTEDGRNITYDF